MFYLFFLLAVLLAFGLFLSVIKTGSFRFWAKAFRIVVVGITVVVFTYYFIQKSVNHFLQDSLTVQVVNKLPFPLDFYIIKIKMLLSAVSRTLYTFLQLLQFYPQDPPPASPTPSHQIHERERRGCFQPNRFRRVGAQP